MKKKLSLAVSLIIVAVALAACLTFTGCGKDVTGSYKNVVDSKTYFAASEVIADMPANETRPDGSSAMVAFRRLMPMLDSRVAPEVNAIVKGEAAPATASVADYYTVSLDLADGKYTLTKEIICKRENANASLVGFLLEDEVPMMKLVFTGSYTVKDGKAILAIPEKVTGAVSPCGQASGYTRFGAGYDEIDCSYTDFSEDSSYPESFFRYFNTLYFVNNASVAEMTVTVDTAAGTFIVG